MKNILITGANGFIAKKLARSLKEEGFFVIGTSRNPCKTINYDEVFCGILGEPLINVFEKYRIDVLIHCAFGNETDCKISAEGTYIWAEQAERHNVGLQIFMSTISADSDALSPYGRTKYELEKWFIAHHHVIFRLGLVVGNEGLFGRIISTVRKSPVIPLIDGGNTLVYLSDVDTISNIVLDSVRNKTKAERGKVWFLQQDTPVIFKDVLKEIRKQYNLFRIFIPVPYYILLAVLNMIEKIKFIRLGIDSTNVKGMRQVKYKSFKSDLHYLGYRETPLDTLIRKTFN